MYTRRLCLPPEKTVCKSRRNRTGHGTTDWLNFRKEYVKAAYCHPACLTSVQSTSGEMPGWMNHKLEIKIAWRNSNNLRYADDTTLMAESEEEIKSLLMQVNEESEKAGLKLNIQKTKITASGPITSWQITGKNGNSGRFYFLGLQNHCRQ